jgi:ABC-type transport system involved in multi-copper enzyme maturation permease subunit
VRNLLRHLAARHGAFVVVSGLLLGAFQWLISAVVSSVDVSGALEAVVQSLPPMVRSLVQEQLFGGFSKSSLLAFGWAHPIAQAIGAAVAIVLATDAIAGAAENGTIELALAQPVSRRAHLGAHVLFAALALAAVTLLGLAGTVAGGRFHHLASFGAGALGALGLDFLALQLAVYGLTLTASAFGREGSRVALFGFLCALVSYLVHVVGTMWETWQPLVRWTLHAWYVPRDVLVDGASVARPVAILLAVALAALLVAWARFRTRDLP